MFGKKKERINVFLAKEAVICYEYISIGFLSPRERWREISDLLILKASEGSIRCIFILTKIFIIYNINLVILINENVVELDTGNLRFSNDLFFIRTI